ncbi:MAG: hypothetical protein ACR2QF_09680 [Geminicoccaceae bacterium]
MIRLTIAAMLASISIPSMAVGASSIEDFAGRWTGEAIEISDQSISPDLLNIDVGERDGGFELSWNDLTQISQDASSVEPLTASFVSTNRENVFEYAPEAGSFLDRMFASPATGNPLDGETLLWARIDADMLAVYKLTIDNNGGFDLGHYSWTRTDDGLLMHYREQTEELGNEIVIEGRLVPAGE